MNNRVFLVEVEVDNGSRFYRERRFVVSSSEDKIVEMIDDYYRQHDSDCWPRVLSVDEIFISSEGVM